MAMKANPQPSDSIGLSSLFQHPPRINTSSPVLGSIISLPPSPLISCSVYTVTHTSTPSEQLTVVESARRRLVADYASCPIVDSLLPSVHVAKDCASLYVFALGSTTEASSSQSLLLAMQLDDLERA